MKSTLIVAAVLATAFMSASAIPAFAQKNVGSYIDSSEFTKAGGSCSLYAGYYQKAFNDLKSAKTKEALRTARENANWAISQGYAAGCAWVDAV